MAFVGGPRRRAHPVSPQHHSLPFSSSAQLVTSLAATVRRVSRTSGTWRAASAFAQGPAAQACPYRHRQPCGRFGRSSSRPSTDVPVLRERTKCSVPATSCFAVRPRPSGILAEREDQGEHRFPDCLPRRLAPSSRMHPTSMLPARPCNEVQTRVAICSLSPSNAVCHARTEFEQRSLRGVESRPCTKPRRGQFNRAGRATRTEPSWCPHVARQREQAIRTVEVPETGPCPSAPSTGAESVTPPGKRLSRFAWTPRSHPASSTKFHERNTRWLAPTAAGAPVAATLVLPSSHVSLSSTFLLPHVVCGEAVSGGGRHSPGVEGAEALGKFGLRLLRSGADWRRPAPGARQ